MFDDKVDYYDNFTIKADNKVYKHNDIYNMTSKLSEEDVYNTIKNYDLSLIKNKSINQLTDILYKIIHNIDDDYMYELPLNIGKAYKYDSLTTKDRNSVFNALVKVYEIVNDDIDEDDFDSFKDGLITVLEI